MKFLIPALIVFAIACPAAAAPATQSQLLAIDSAFAEGAYAYVELLSLRLLQSGEDLTPQERSRVHVTVGYALIMMNREPDAREHFRDALDADPALTLDPIQVSPKFRMVFDEVRSEYFGRHPRDRKPEQTADVRAPAASTMLSNLIIPGSGQWREGRRVRGAAYLLAQAAAIGVLVWQVGELRDSHSEYLAQTDPQRIRETYDAYNRDYALAWGAGALTAAVYLAAQADLVLFRTADSPLEIQACGPGRAVVSLTVRW